jgi:hypothetical protein
MKNMKLKFLSSMLVIVVLASPIWAEMATMDEALTVAENWITCVIQREGSWGSSDWAEVEDIQEFTRNGRVIGHFFKVEPVGFIVVSIRKELAPVKAYSAECNLNPQSDEGMADLLKTKMEGLLDVIEQSRGAIKAAGVSDVRDLLEIDYRPAWDELCGGIRALGEDLESIQAADSFGQVGPLLSSSWHQGDPYNQECQPASGDCTQDRCAVGCVALAGAQIMRYWAWPPWGENHLDNHRVNFEDDYDWLSMPDELTVSSDEDQINAVSELCYEIGKAVGMEYCLKGCQSGAYTSDMNDVYVNHYRYSPNCSFGGWSYNYENWFYFIKKQINANRLVHYSLKDHSLVVDGWKVGPAGQKYHMNYGWAGKVPNPDSPAYCPDWDIYDNSNAWYTLDALPCSDPNDEYMGINIYPAQALGAELTEESYEKNEEFPYWYFDLDATGESVTFEAGQELQFLPKVTVTCTGTGDDSIRFEGTNSNNTRLFSIKGTATGGKVAEARIYDGQIRLYQNGSIKFHE